MKTLRQCVQEALEKKVAIGHFNFSDTEGLRAIFNAARALKIPVIAGVSEKERDFVGVRQAVALVKSLREEFDYPVFINADHTYSFERVREAVDAGYDAIIFDGAKLSLDANIAMTKQCVEYARKVNREVIVEGELGYIGTSSRLLETLPEGVSLSHLTTAADSERFVRESGVDLFAPSVGNIHGMLKHVPNPRLHLDRVREIAEALKVPLVLHGGSGIADADFIGAIDAGVAIIHINTELRVAYQHGVSASVKDHPEEIAPYAFMAPGVTEMEKVVGERLKLFNKL